MESYVIGYRQGYYSQASSTENPYVPSEGLLDYNMWEEGRQDGSLDQLKGRIPVYPSAEN